MVKKAGPHVTSGDSKSVIMKGVKCFEYPKGKCHKCGGILQIPAGEEPVQAMLCDGLQITNACTIRKRCSRRQCRASHRPNYRWRVSEKINTLSAVTLKHTGVYFVSDYCAFTEPYLRMSVVRLLRGRLMPGSEASALKSVFGEDLQISHRKLRDLLLHAMEGVALMLTSPLKQWPFNVDDPSAGTHYNRDDFLFDPEGRVGVLAFDGLFGIHRPLDVDLDPPRSKWYSGRNKKGLKDNHRAASCTDKDKVRLVLPGRTGGWQFVLDPVSGRCLGATEHLENENMSDRIRILSKVCSMPLVKPTVLVHDDACHFEDYMRRHHRNTFQSVRHIVCDRFHQKNHKCHKCRYTRAQESILNGINTSICEQFNSWIRGLNPFLNNVGPTRHRFWVEQAILHWNKYVKTVDPRHRLPRRNVKARSGYAFTK